MVVDEAVSEQYIRKESSSKARLLLIVMWMVAGFLLCASYKSVLLATLVSVEYEKPVDTLDDLLETEKPIVGYPTIAYFLETDPRIKMREVANKFDGENWALPYGSIYRKQYVCLIMRSSLFLKKILFRIPPRFFQSELIKLGGPLDRRIYGDRVYVGKELFFSFGYSYVVPKASPLQVSAQLPSMCTLQA